MVSRAGAVRDVTEAAVPRFAAILAAVLPVGLLVQALAELRDYRHPALPVAVWLSLLVAAWWLIPRARGGGLTRGQAAAAMAVAVAAVSAVGWDRRPHSPAGALDWSIFGAVWLLAFVALSRPAWEWVAGALLVLALNGFFVLRLLGTNATGISRLTAATYVVVVILSVFAALRPALRVLAGLAARQAELASRSAAERAAIAAIQEDRRDRFALLELEALPLLRGIADGSLDPAGQDVREECARHATTLRRALAGRAGLGRELLAGLEPALSAARRRGLQVEVRVVGDPGLPSREVAQATLGAVDTVLRALPGQAVSLTVLGPGPDVELYLTFARLPAAARAEVLAPALAPAL
ncbi:MAG: putative signal transduction histidine kinase, partial [Actinomycetia bacterium]|nr:putative signal transduction histidine kinase [Actinomycetes bacterium]